MFRNRLLLIVTVVCVQSLGATRIAGDISTVTFSAPAGPFIVEKDIVVPRGESVTMEPGCVLLFSAFTGLRVEGGIVVKGEAKRPVVFTSVHDAEHNPSSAQLPNPFDWNGIYVTENAGQCRFDNIAVLYSVYGLKSDNPDVRISDGLFRQNGQFHFTVNNTIQFVQESIPYSYNVRAPSGPATGGAGGKNGAAMRARPRERSGKQTVGVRFTCLGIGLVGSGIGAAFAARTSRNVDRLVEINAAPRQFDEREYSDAIDAKQGSIAGLAVSFGAGLLGFVGFGVSFAF